VIPLAFIPSPPFSSPTPLSSLHPDLRFPTYRFSLHHRFTASLSKDLPSCAALSPVSLLHRLLVSLLELPRLGTDDRDADDGDDGSDGGRSEVEGVTSIRFYSRRSPRKVPPKVQLVLVDGEVFCHVHLALHQRRSVGGPVSLPQALVRVKV
jgi:hypothetical protein